MPLPHNLRSPVNPTSPDAQGICDRCGFQFAHKDLSWQFEWRGNALSNLRILVCQTCLDVPQEQLRPRILPPDPVPIMNPRPPAWAAQEGPPPPPESVLQLIGEEGV